jgi:hypothetical protein
MMSAFDIRNERLAQLSQMVVNGQICHKLDHIATIYINSRFYFNVFRRYNSPYNIVIEDPNSDIYLQQDHTIRTSLKTVLCLPDYEASNIYTWNATSYKHNGPVPSVDKDIADMRWSEVHGNYHAISVNFGGIFHYEHIMPTPEQDVKDECPSTPRSQIVQSPLNPPNAPERPSRTKEDIEAANILVSLSIPQNSDPFGLRESDGPTLSMRFSDILNRRNMASCYCQMDEECDEESDNEYDEDDYDENNFIVLRNGTLVPKPTQ